MNKIGILIHGRHLQTKQWERIVWGEPPRKLGTLPRAVLEVLIRGPENVASIVVGTGASEKNGVIEAVAMKQYLCDRLTKLGEFSSIARHPRFQSTHDQETITTLCNQIVTETTSQNTNQGIAKAVPVFVGCDCTEVYQVTGGSHAPRTELETLKAQHRGDIPADQYWYTVGDDMTYADTDIDDVVVIEPPHRGDDSRLTEPIEMHKVIPRLFKLDSEKRVAILQKIEEMLGN